MRRQTNKDLEQEYKDQFMRGFSMQEAGWIALAIGVVIAVATVLTLLGLRIDFSIFIAIPFAAPVIYIGFRKHYGMSQLEYWKACRYEAATRELTCEETLKDENVEPFSMTRKR